MSNREQLRQLKETHGLTVNRISELLAVKPQTVRSWLCVGGRRIPDSKLELLHYKVKL